MGRILIILYSAFLIFVSYMSSRFPHSIINSFVSASPGWDNFRIGLAVALLLFLVTYYFRIWPIRAALGAAALLMLALGIVGTFSDTFFGIAAIDLRLLDIFILIEGGIVSSMASLDYYPKISFDGVVEPQPEPLTTYSVSLFFLDRPPVRSTKTGRPNTNFS